MTGKEVILQKVVESLSDGEIKLLFNLLRKEEDTRLMKKFEASDSLVMFQFEGEQAVIEINKELRSQKVRDYFFSICLQEGWDCPRARHTSICVELDKDHKDYDENEDYGHLQNAGFRDAVSGEIYIAERCTDY